MHGSMMKPAQSSRSRSVSCATKTSEVVHVDTHTPDFDDATVRYVEIAGDSALEVQAMTH